MYRGDPILAPILGEYSPVRKDRHCTNNCIFMWKEFEMKSAGSTLDLNRCEEGHFDLSSSLCTVVQDKMINGTCTGRCGSKFYSSKKYVVLQDGDLKNAKLPMNVDSISSLVLFHFLSRRNHLYLASLNILATLSTLSTLKTSRNPAILSIAAGRTLKPCTNISST